MSHSQHPVSIVRVAFKSLISRNSHNVSAGPDVVSQAARTASLLRWIYLTYKVTGELPFRGFSWPMRGGRIGEESQALSGEGSAWESPQVTAAMVCTWSVAGTYIRGWQRSAVDLVQGR